MISTRTREHLLETKMIFIDKLVESNNQEVNLLIMWVPGSSSNKCIITQPIHL